MRINELFDAIKNCPKMGSVSKRDLYSTVRTILDNRNSLNIRNSVADLYENASRIEDALASEIEEVDTYLDIILTLPEVQEHLRNKGMLESNEEEENDNSDSDSDSEIDGSNSDDDGSHDDNDNPDSKDDGNEVSIKVNVEIPFSWVMTVTMVVSVLNLLIAINNIPSATTLAPTSCPFVK